MILVEGELQTRQYVDKNGNTQNVVELVVSNANFTGEPKQPGYGSYSSNAPTPPPAAGSPHIAADSESSENNSDFVETDGSDDGYPF